jgi:hypothetical protein
VSRYLLLVILNLPLISAGLLGALVDYKLGKITHKKYAGQTLLWLFILLSLAAAKPIYEFLFNHQLTQTEPLSLFDVIQITGVVLVLFMANRSRIKVDSLERKVQDLHQELSIRLSENTKAKGAKNDK